MKVLHSLRPISWFVHSLEKGKKKLKNFDKTSINDSRVTYLLFLCQLTKGETMTITASAKDFKRKILEVMDAI